MIHAVENFAIVKLYDRFDFQCQEKHKNYSINVQYMSYNVRQHETTLKI